MNAWTASSPADVYVGTDAGSALYEDILRARRSVRVVSPYLGPQLVDLLVGCEGRGIDVRVITAHDGSNRRDLASAVVTQTREVDRRRRLLARYGSFLALVLFIVSAERYVAGLHAWDGLTAGIAVASMVVIGLLFYGLRRLPIYAYRYGYRLAGLRVVPSPRCYSLGQRSLAPPFIHAKLYVIDDTQAYLGSVNLTKGGLFHNLEVIVRLRSPEAVAGLARYIDQLFTDALLPAYGPEVWARRHFTEGRGTSSTPSSTTSAASPATPSTTSRCAAPWRRSASR
jgi:phosphatidylserine/phosphatidylglycerophosphate/cardiolipin synthase-like enzyme